MGCVSLPYLTPLTQLVTQHSNIVINCASVYPILLYCFDVCLFLLFFLAAWWSYWSRSFRHNAATHSSACNRPLKLSSKHLSAVRTLKCTTGLPDKSGEAFICRHFTPPFSFSVLAFYIFCTSHHSRRTSWSAALLLHCTVAELSGGLDSAVVFRSGSRSFWA